MTITASAGRAPVSLRLSDVPLLVWCLLGVALLAALDLTFSPGRLLASLGDTDDATRLTEVRLLLSGAPWYDMAIPRLGGTEPLVSHWSRLVDLPLAALMTVFGLFTTAGNAELLTRYVWPLLVLLAMLLLIARAAEARSDRIGAVTAVLLTVTALSATSQFMPGRIDHHNMMILGAVGGILLLAESFTAPRAGWWAGALLALGTAVGYEALLLTVAALAIANIQPLVTGRGGEGARRASIAYAATLSVLMLATVGPGQLLVPRCDQVSPNIAILAAFGAAGSALAHCTLARASLQFRFAALAGAVIVGAGVYAAIEPACLKGPFGQVEPAAIPVWLVNVREAQSIFWLMGTAPTAAWVFLLFASAGLAASAWLAWRKPWDGFILLLAIHAAALLLAVWQIKTMPYASLLSVVALAVLPAELAARTRFSRPIVRLVATLLGSQIVMIAIVSPVVEAMHLTPADKAEASKRARECLTSKSIAPLAALPPGLAVNDVDLGPFLVASTRLDAVAAPYHRIGRQIVDADAVLFGPLDGAEALARRLQADYIAICPELVGSSKVERRGLRHALLEGKTLAWLEPVSIPGETPLRVWRIKR